MMEMMGCNTDQVRRDVDLISVFICSSPVGELLFSSLPLRIRAICTLQSTAIIQPPQNKTKHRIFLTFPPITHYNYES